jgi:hypothetical protein
MKGFVGAEPKFYQHGHHQALNPVAAAPIAPSPRHKDWPVWRKHALDDATD